MKTTTKILGALALALLPSTALGRADEAPPGKALFQESAQDSQEELLKPADEEAFGWNGEAPDPDRLLEEIAESRVVMLAEGRLDEAEQSLNQIWLRATATKGFDGQSEILVQIALARADLYRRQGKQQAAVQATRQLLLRRPDLSLLKTERAKVTLASQALRVRAVQASNDPRLLQLRQELVSLAAKPGHDSLAEIVRDAYAQGDFNVIREIGAPAQAVFAEEIVSDADHFPPSVGSDPLLVFLHMNERRAAEILLANLEVGGYLWKRRIIRAMDAVDVMNNPGTWSSDSPYVCLEPEWLAVLEVMLASPETAPQSVHLITEPVLRDHLTEEIQRSLIRGIQTYELDFTNAVLQTLDEGGVVESARPVLEACAHHENPQVRRFAARLLANFESNATLKGLADDPDPEVRYSVIRTLQPHRGSFTKRYFEHGSWRVSTSQKSFQPNLDESDRELIRRFARDPSSKVRRSAVGALYGLEPALEVEVYLRLARDENAGVRQSMAWNDKLDGAIRSQILLQLAGDSSESVVSDVDSVIEDALAAGDPTPFLPALSVRIKDKRLPMDASTRSGIVNNLVKTPPGLRAIAQWTLADEDRVLQDLLFRCLYQEGTERLLALSDETLASLYARSHEYQSGTNSHYFNNVQSILENARPSRREAMRLVLEDPSNDVAVRLNAAVLAARDGGQRFGAAFRDLLRDEYWKTNAASQGDMRSIYNAVSELPDSEENALVLSLVADAEIPVPLVQYAARDYLSSGPQGRELTLAVLQAWFDPGGFHVPVVEQAILHLSSLPEDADPELLQSAALTAPYARAAVQTMVALHREEFLPTLERCMQAEWVTDQGERQRVRYDAATGVASFLSDEAAEILLRGLASPDANLRQLCSQGIDHIQTTRERYRSWDESKEGKPTRESALVDLLRMVDDENQGIRVQAIRGIATFGAIEYLPRLIRLLEDPDGIIVEAALEAIDELNRTAAAQRKNESGD